MCVLSLLVSVSLVRLGYQCKLEEDKVLVLNLCGKKILSF